MIPNRVKDTWFLEITALSASLAFLTATIVTLAIFNHSPVFNWHGVTLNAVVSILNTGSKGCLLLAVAESISQSKWVLFSESEHRLCDFDVIDAASRGPLGCSKAMVSRIGWFGFYIGPVVTLFAIVMDPFAQQLVQIQSRVFYTADNSSATLPRAQRYSKGTEYSLGPDPWSIGDVTIGAITIAYSDFAMQSAITYGLSQKLKSVNQQLPNTCSSGNCTWDSTHSLAVCSRCASLNNLVTETTVLNNVPLASAYYATDAVVTANFTKFSLPNGLTVDATVGMSALPVYEPQNSTTFQDNSLMFFSMTFLTVTKGANTGDYSKLINVNNNISVDATECVLQFCVNEYKSAVVNGAVIENATLLATATRDPESWTPIDGGSNVWFPSDPLYFNRLNSTIGRTDLRIGNGFNISQTGIDGISQYLQSIMNPTHLYGNSTMPGLALANVYDPNTMQAFYESRDLANTFQALAASMSNAIRAGADSLPNSSLSGQVGLYRSYYVIQWPWIALSTVLIPLAFLHIWLVKRRGRKVDAPLLKSEPLAILACTGKAITKSEGLLTISAIEKGTKGLKARLDNDHVLHVRATETSSSLLEFEERTTPKAASPNLMPLIPFGGINARAAEQGA